MTNCSPIKQKKPKVEKNDEFVCSFCKRSFVREKTLFAHSCEQKRRFLQRDEKPVKLGFIAYQQFYHRSMPKRQAPTYEGFAKSKLYTAFVNFGRHIVDFNAVNPLAFIDFILRVDVPIDKWVNPTLYQTYIRELNKNETPLDALERSFGLMQQWAHDSGNDWRQFFRLVECPLAALWIANGRISPWILFIASSAHDLMSRLTPDQTALIEKNIDPDFWRLKIERHKSDVDLIRDTLAENGI